MLKSTRCLTTRSSMTTRTDGVNCDGGIVFLRASRGIRIERQTDEKNDQIREAFLLMAECGGKRGHR